MEQTNQRVLVLDATTLQTWEIMAELHIRLAYPDVMPARRQRLINSVCADYVATLIEANPARQTELASRFPHYNPGLRIGRQHMTENFEQAQLVGTIVLGLIKETALGSQNVIEGKPRNISRDFAVQFIWPPDHGSGNHKYDTWVHDLEKREFRARYPVAHLAAALQLIARKRDAVGEAMTFVYDDFDFLREWLATAAVMAGHIRATPELSKPNGMASKLLNITLVEPPNEARTFPCDP